MRKSIINPKNYESRVSLKDILYNDKQFHQFQTKIDHMSKLTKYQF